jgi:hypothetical protein
MPVSRVDAPDLIIGTYRCPKTNERVPIHSSRPLAFVDWPLRVSKCSACGAEHVLSGEDLEHPPVFGYE